MPAYRVTAIGPDQTRRDLVVDAPSELEAARSARQTGVVVRVDPNTAIFAFRSSLTKDLQWTASLNQSEIAALATEWSGLLAAGIPLHDALRLSLDGARRARAIRRLRPIYESVREGRALSQALADDGSFSNAFVALVGAAEASGSLTETMQEIATQLNERRVLAAATRSALLYPAFLTVTAGGAILVLLTVVVPSLQALIDPRSVNALPAVTSLVIAASEFLRAHGLAVGAFTGAAVAFAAFGWRLPIVRTAMERLLLRVPIANRVAVGFAVARYCQTLSALLRGNVSVAKALPLATRTVGNRLLRNGLAEAHQAVLRGGRLSSSFSALPWMPRDVTALVRLGEHNGQLAAALSQAASAIQFRTKQTLLTVTTLIGPALTLFFGLVAGVIVYAMLSTILSVNQLAFQ